MKVLQILPELHAGGVERGTLELGQHLVQNGHSSVVISNGGRLVEPLEEQGSRHIRLPVHRKSIFSLSQVGALRDILHAEQPDILHARSRVPAWLAWLAWRKMPPASRPKFVTTVHGFYSVSPYSAIMTKGEAVICVSSAVRQYVTQNYPRVSPEKLCVIHRGVDPEAYPNGYQPSPEWLQNWTKEFPKTRGKFIVALPGRITRWKGALDFLQVIAALKEKGIPVHGLLIGEAHPRKQDFYQALHAAIYRAKLEKDISLTGHRGDLREIMAASDVVVSCSTDPEAFGRVTLEALTLGKPIAGYDHGGVREQLDALLPSGKIPIGDTSAMAECLAAWQTAPPQPKANDQFTLQNMLEQICATYTDLLKPVK